jgi:hypothetical protein
MIYKKDDLVTIKIRRKTFNGVIENIEKAIYNNNQSIRNAYFVRYELDESGRKTTGWFYNEDLLPRKDKKIVINDLVKREMMRVKCKRCEKSFCVEKNEEYGYCPYCMCKEFSEIGVIGVF